MKDRVTIKKYAFHYYIDSVHYLEILDFKPDCKGREFVDEIVEIIDVDENEEWFKNITKEQ